MRRRKSIEKELAPVGVIKSTTHGRIRMQLRPEYRTPEMMAQIKAQLEKDRTGQGSDDQRAHRQCHGEVCVRAQSGHGLLWKAIRKLSLWVRLRLNWNLRTRRKQESRKRRAAARRHLWQTGRTGCRFDLQIRPGSFPAHPWQDSPARAGGSARPCRSWRGSDRHIRNRTGAAAGASSDLDRP